MDKKKLIERREEGEGWELKRVKKHDSTDGAAYRAMQER